MANNQKSFSKTEKDIYDDFVSKYSYLYFVPNSLKGVEKYTTCYQKSDPSDKDRNKKLEEVGIHNLNATDYNAEEKVVTEYLSKGTFNEVSLAWKAGRLTWDYKLHSLSFINFESEDKESYRNGLGSLILKTEFDKYCELLSEKKETILRALPSDINCIDNWKSIYKKHLKEYNPPKNIGPVYIINALFFLSKGRLPIYDAFAHKAIRALALDIAPNQVFLGTNPDKTDVKGVATMYCEYMMLLKKVFDKQISKDKNMFISRELDRALWVYGHATQKYPAEKNGKQ